MNPAEKYFNLERKPEDFGQTLGYYGVGEGFHVVLPFLGPSNLRDMVGLVADSYTSPLSNTGSSDLRYKIPDTQTQSLAIRATSVVNGTSLRLGLYESLKKDNDKQIETYKDNAITYLLQAHPDSFKQALEFDDWKGSQRFLNNNKYAAIIFSKENGK